MIMQSPPFRVQTAEDREMVADFARLLYLVYCEKKEFTPSDAPYAPAWAYDYAKTAVLWLGYDEGGADAVREVVGAA